MAFRDFPAQHLGIQLLQRSLERKRLSHAYLFTGDELGGLETIARTLAKTLNCQLPIRRQGAATDSCDKCASCRKIDRGNHADVYWVRPESKSRVVTTEQMRSLMSTIQLKATEAEYKVATIVAADRLGIQAANAFLKTLEEPPPKSVLILTSTDPQRILETLLSRCLRLNFSSDSSKPLGQAQTEWLTSFSDMAAREQKSLLSRYRLLDVLLKRLTQIKARIDEDLTARSPLQQYKDAEKEYVDRWEDEVAAAIEAEYRRERGELLSLVHWWLRDVWVHTLSEQNPVPNRAPAAGDLLRFPQLDGARAVARRISPGDALANLETLDELQAWLNTNMQEALALEVGLLKLHL